MKFILNLFFVSILFVSYRSYANEPLVFRQDISPSNKIALSGVLSGHITSYSFAPIDLNEDGVDEYITKQVKKCKKMCAFSVLALNSEGVALEIGSVKSRDIQVQITKNHGIRDIKGIGNAQNDFEESLYIWDTGASRYILEE